MAYIDSIALFNNPDVNTLVVTAVDMAPRCYRCGNTVNFADHNQCNDCLSNALDNLESDDTEVFD